MNGVNSGYPKRLPFFANKFIRLMTKKCVANELGPQVFTLLAVIAMQEDARGYDGPVNWYNCQLMPLVGAASEDTLDRIRKKAVDAGWLNYAPGRRAVPGYYFVTIPERYRDTDDSPTDEGPDELSHRTNAGISAETSTGATAEGTSAAEALPRNDAVTTAETNTGNEPFLRTSAETIRGNVREEPGDKCGTPIPIPSPIPSSASVPDAVLSLEGKQKPKPTKKSAETHPLFARFWAAYPRKTAKEKADKAFAKLNPDESLVERILTALAWQTKSDDWTKDGGKYIPFPATWLNGKRWEDEQPNRSSISANPLESERKELQHLVRNDGMQREEAESQFYQKYGVHLYDRAATT